MNDALPFWYYTIVGRDAAGERVSRDVNRHGVRLSDDQLEEIARDLGIVEIVEVWECDLNRI